MNRLSQVMNFLKTPYGIALILLTFTVSIYFYFHHRNVSALINQAASSYVQAEQAVSRYDRQQLFNSTLEQYLEMEKKYHPTYGSGKLYYNIASTLFQLEEYPTAILYDYKALKLDPGDKKAKENLEVIWNRIGLKPDHSERSAFAMMLMEGTLSLPVRLQLFALFVAVTFALLSWMLWWPSIANKLGAIACGVMTAYFAVSVFYTQFVVPVEGVLITSSGLYRDAGLQYAKVVDQPIVSGSKVVVVDYTPNRDWVKIMTPDGNLGYVPVKSLRLI